MHRMSPKASTASSPHRKTWPISAKKLCMLRFKWNWSTICKESGAITIMANSSQLLCLKQCAASESVSSGGCETTKMLANIIMKRTLLHESCHWAKTFSGEFIDQTRMLPVTWFHSPCFEESCYWIGDTLDKLGRYLQMYKGQIKFGDFFKNRILFV